MTKQEYQEQRNQLMSDAEALMAESNIEEANGVMKKVEGLDNEWEEIALANANMEALRDEQTPVILENKSVELKGDEKKVENTNILEMNPVDVVSTPEYRNAWLKKLQGKSLTQQENTVVTASGAIPTDTLNKIVEKMEYIAPILAKIDLSFIPANLSIPVDDTVNDASWVAVGTASTDSSDSITTISLAAYKLIKTVEIGADVALMAIPAFEAYLVNKLAKKMAKALENAVFNGTGSSQPTGLLKAGEITNTGEYTKAAMTFTDILTIIGNLPDHGYRIDACFAMPSALWYSDVLPALATKSEAFDLQAAEKENILGYPVILCDRIAAGTIVFGDFSFYAMNISAGVEIANDKSVGFRSGSTVYRALALVDGKKVTADAFNKYTRSAT